MFVRPIAGMRHDSTRGLNFGVDTSCHDRKFDCLAFRAIE